MRSANVRVRFEECGDASERTKTSNVPKVMEHAVAQKNRLCQRRGLIRPEVASDFFCIGWGLSGTETGVCKIGFTVTSEKFRVKRNKTAVHLPRTERKKVRNQRKETHHVFRVEC